MNDELMAELTEQFRAGTFDRLATLRTLVARLACERADRELLTTVHRHFHGLAGLGGTYGFPLVSDVAADAELACESLREGEAVGDELLALLERTIAAIDADLRRA